MHDDQDSITRLNSSVANLRIHQRQLKRQTLLSLLRTADNRLTVAELAVGLGVSKPSIDRLIRDLAGEGLIKVVDGRIWLDPESDPDQGETDSGGIATNGDTTLHTDNAQSQPNGAPADESSTAESGWPRWANMALRHSDTARRRTVRFIEADPEGAARLVGSILVAAVIVILGVSLIGQLLTWAVTGNPLHDLAGILPARELATDPIMGWLTSHTAGTGISAQTAAWAWGVTGLIIWFSAWCHHLGAQLVLWPAYGAASVTMAWVGTSTAAHRPVAAAVIAIAWAGLSLFALNRRPLPRAVIRRRYATDTPAGGEEAGR